MVLNDATVSTDAIAGEKRTTTDIGKSKVFLRNYGRWLVRAVFTSNCTLRNHHFQFQNCTLHTLKSHIEHFQFQNCTLRNCNS